MMRTFRAQMGSCVWIAALLLVRDLAGAQASPPLTARLDVIVIEPGSGALGDNELTLVLSNASGVSVPALVSVRLESPARGAQRGHYRRLGPGERVAWTIPYRVPNRTYRLLRVMAGIAESMPTEETPYPGFSGAFEQRRFALSPPPDVTDAPDWEFGERPDVTAARIGAIRDAIETALTGARDSLRRLVGWDRRALAGFAPRLLSEERLGPYHLCTMQIAGEPGSPITFLLLRRDDQVGRLPTVLYLTGNPPGTKESGVVPAMILADAGFLVATVDRRESARTTDPGEFLQNIADPVFDARRLIDYLSTRSDVEGGGVSVLGFSMGAQEGMFLAALHPRVWAAVLASRIVDHDSLFASPAWAPTLWSPEVLEDVGVGHLLGDWGALRDALTPEVGRRARAAYRARYPFFERINPPIVLPLAAPRPVLIIAGALDSQFPLGGVLAADRAVRERYAELNLADASALHIMPRGGHPLTPMAFDRAVEWLRLWTLLASRW